MKTCGSQLGRLILGMRSVYSDGGNAMAWARENSGQKGNLLSSTLVAYDLQAGSYVAQARKNPEYITKWCLQLADLIRPYAASGDSILEVGVGEATTLAGVLNELNTVPLKVFGLDVSWSRINTAQNWMVENSQTAELFVGDMFKIPFPDNSIDIVFTSHSLEPNGGREEEGIKKLLRVARKAVVLVEPMYELATEEAQKRMTAHGYIKGLRVIADDLGVCVNEYGLLDVNANPLNPSGVMLIVKDEQVKDYKLGNAERWQCPITGASMASEGDLFYAKSVGIAYPIMRGVAMLRPEHGVVASKI